MRLYWGKDINIHLKKWGIDIKDFYNEFDELILKSRAEQLELIKLN